MSGEMIAMLSIGVALAGLHLRVSSVLRGEIGALRTRLGTEIGALKGELRQDVASLRTEMREDLGGLRTETRDWFARLDVRIRFLEEKAFLEPGRAAASAG